MPVRASPGAELGEALDLVLPEHLAAAGGAQGSLPRGSELFRVFARRERDWAAIFLLGVSPTLQGFEPGALLGRGAASPLKDH